MLGLLIGVQLVHFVNSGALWLPLGMAFVGGLLGTFWGRRPKAEGA